MSPYQRSIASLPPQEALLFYFLKEMGWTRQSEIIHYRGKDEARTRELLNILLRKGLLQSKYIKIKVRVGKIQAQRQVRIWNIKHK